MRGLVGKKIGMTSVFDEIGRSIPVTVVEVPAAVITQIKTEEKDGYNAVQLASFERKEKNLSKAVNGHLAKAGTSSKAVISEFRDFIPEGLVEGDELTIDDVFSVGDIVDIAGTSKGRGFAGVIKRHNFSGVVMKLTVSITDFVLPVQSVVLLILLVYLKVCEWLVNMEIAVLK